MNLNPDPVTERIKAKHQASQMARLRQLEVEGRDVLIRAQAAIRDCKIHAGRVTAMIAEIRQGDETTIRLPVLPEQTDGIGPA